MKFKKQVAVEVAVGAFTCAVIAVLLALTTILSEESIFKDYVFIEVVFDNINGLRTGDEVNARGVTVGKVKQIALKPDGVHVHARLDVPVELRADYRISVLSGSVLGGRLMGIYEGSPDAERVSLKQPLQGSPSTELLDTATKTLKDIQTALNEGILEDLKASMGHVRKITESIGEGDGMISRLLHDQELFGDVQRIVANVRSISDAIAQGEGTVGRLVMNDEVYQQLQTIAANLNDISGRLAKGEGTMGRLLGEDDQVYRDLAATIAQVRQIAEGVGRGEGSVGKLLADDELYSQFQSLLREGRAAMDDFRETSPITTFTSIFFGIF